MPLLYTLYISKVPLPSKFVLLVKPMGTEPSSSISQKSTMAE